MEFKCAWSSCKFKHFETESQWLGWLIPAKKRERDTIFIISVKQNKWCLLLLLFLPLKCFWIEVLLGLNRAANCNSLLKFSSSYIRGRRIFKYFIRNFEEEAKYGSIIWSSGIFCFHNIFYSKLLSSLVDCVSW